MSEDALPTKYAYAWTAASDIPLPDFLTKYKPSMIQNDGTKPWIWVSRGIPAREDEGQEAALEEASVLLKEVTARVESIKNDASIPTRSNKKTGAKSKKEVREEVQAQAADKFKEVATRHGYVSGKWLVFAPADRVDAIWSSLATSLISGPLAVTCAWRAKVATSPADADVSTQHLICLYMPDVYDKPAVTDVMRILLKNHGLSLSGAKANLYTALGLDSKHPSGVPSTTWKNAALLPEAESKALKDAYFAELATAKAVPKPAADKPDGATAKAKPRLQKKKVDDDPFASDDEGEKEAAAAKKALPQPAPKKTAGPLPKAKAAEKRPKDSDDEEEEERPKKKKAGKK
ncbi:translation initiation factor eIF 4e-like domain-containing protein [Mycena sp. CBHHK59/15]|nr:translation initiation factor eIF 4e-like domain-containing protein [Mycena sp. CBHHK59/15]